MNNQPSTGFSRQRDILNRFPFSAATLWRMVRRGDFPQPLKLSPGVTAWCNSDIETWVSARTSRPN